MNPDPFNRPAILWVPFQIPEPEPCWLRERIDACIDSMELQMMGIKG